MGFDWGRASAGLLGSAGKMMLGKAQYMQEQEDKLAEKKLEEQIWNRREAARLAKEKSMQILGYTEEGAPMDRATYESLPEGERPGLFASGKSRKTDEPRLYADASGKTYTAEQVRAMEEEGDLPAGLHPVTGSSRSGGSGSEKDPEALKPADLKKMADSLREEFDAAMESFDDGSSKGILGFGSKPATNKAPTFAEWVRENRPYEYSVLAKNGYFGAEQAAQPGDASGETDPIAADQPATAPDSPAGDPVLDLLTSAKQRTQQQSDPMQQPGMQTLPQEGTPPEPQTMPQEGAPPEPTKLAQAEQPPTWEKQPDIEPPRDNQSGLLGIGRRAMGMDREQNREVATLQQIIPQAKGEGDREYQMKIQSIAADLRKMMDQYPRGEKETTEAYIQRLYELYKGNNQDNPWALK